MAELIAAVTGSGSNAAEAEGGEEAPAQTPDALKSGVSNPHMGEDGDIDAFCQYHLRQTSCTSWDPENKQYDWAPVRSSPEKLGEITGSVGVQLYFNFVKQMGCLFFVMFLLSLPMLIFNLNGSMLSSTSALNEYIGKASIANIGNCPTGGCRSTEEYENRCLFDGDCGEDGLKVKDVAQTLGLLDGLALLLFVVFGSYFGNYAIPKAVHLFDAATLTPADYTVCIAFPPRFLGGSGKSEQHQDYKGLLKKHFINVLKNLPKEDGPVDDEEAVNRITLVYEYDGQVREFMTKGNYLREKKNAIQLGAKYLENGKEAKAKKQEARVIKFDEKIDKIDEHFAKESSIPEKERAVCRAYITFQKIEYMNKVLWHYRFAKYRLFRLCQRAELQFEGNKIFIGQAVEPGDLYWENLDFNEYKRLMRRALTIFLSILVLVVCSLLLVSVKASTTLETENEYDTWIIKHEPTEGTSACLRICSWDLYKKSSCKGYESSSSTWPASRQFTLNSQASISYSPSSGTSEVCTPIWESPGCTNSGTEEALAKDWLGIQFDEEREVGCMEIIQSTSTERVADLRIYGCNSAALPASNSTADWEPADYCIPMQVVHPDVDFAVGDTGVHSDDLRVVKDASCGAAVEIEAARAALAREDDVTVNCFCTQQLMADPNLIRPPFESPAQLVCEDWSKDQAFTYGMMIVGVLGVCILNQVLLVFFQFLVGFERLATVTDVTQSQLWKLFLAQFVNTGLLTFLVNWKLQSVPAPLMVITEPLSIGKGAYYEANGAWFEAVGCALLITVLTQVFSTTFTPVIMARVVAPLKRKFIVMQGTKVTKEVLAKVYELPSWNIALRAAQTMNVICCVLFYSGGMPLMYFIGMMYCFTAYWLDKYTLLRGSHRPASYSEEVMNTCMGFFPIAVLLHATFACFVLGNPDLLPSDWSSLKGFAEGLFGVSSDQYIEIREEWEVASSDRKDELYGDYFRTRFLDFARMSSWLLMLIFLVGIVYYILYYLDLYLLGPLFAPVKAAIRECFKKLGCCKPKVEEVETQKTYEEAQVVIKRNGLPVTYEMSDNRWYSHAAEAVQHYHARASSLIQAPAQEAPAEEAKEEEKPEEAKEEEEAKEDAV